MSDVFQRISDMLCGAAADFTVLEHAPVFTSEEAAAVRGTPLSSGAKALVCKVDDEFRLFVLPADRKLAGKALRKQHGWKSIRFADRDELAALTGLTPGAVPPFGSLFGLKTACDERLGEHERINFNAGDHARSISLLWADYLRVEQPELGHYGE